MYAVIAPVQNCIYMWQEVAENGVRRRICSRTVELGFRGEMAKISLGYIITLEL